MRGICMLTVSVASFLLLVVVDAAVRENASNKAKKIMPERRLLNSLADSKRKDLHKILNANSHYDFQLVRSAKTVQGTTKQRLQVTFDGLPVIGVNMQATYDENEGYNGGMTGQIVSAIENDIPDSSACMRKKKFMFLEGKKKFGLPKNCKYCELKASDRAVYLDANTKAHLVYTIDIIDTQPMNSSWPLLVVDACNLVTYEMFNRIPIQKKPKITSSQRRNVQKVSNNYKRQTCATAASGTGGNTNTGPINYGTFPYCLDVTVSGSNCQLSNTYVRVIDMDQSTSTSRKQAYQYDCTNTNDAINGATSANLDAFFYGNVVSSIFQNKYNINYPLGKKMTFHTHYGSRYENAYFDGISVKFGDGANYFYPLVSLDVLAHEVAHGVTDVYSKLYYSKQSGGINEAFSDITGEAIEFLASYRTNDWGVGYDIAKGGDWALRYFKDPTIDGGSISNINNYYDGLDVHLSSGIYNKAFYEMVYTQNLQMEDVYGCFLRANMMYWGVQTGFVQGACDVQSAAIDLGIDVAKIQAAFSVVGIDSNSCSGGGGGGGDGGGGDGGGGDGGSGDGGGGDGGGGDGGDGGGGDGGGGGGNDGMVNLQPGLIQISVSDTTNPCYLLLPVSADWSNFYITTKSSKRTKISIIYKNGVTGEVIATKSKSVQFDLPANKEDRIVCFSATILTTVDVDTYYCGSTCHH